MKKQLELLCRRENRSNLLAREHRLLIIIGFVPFDRVNIEEKKGRERERERFVMDFFYPSIGNRRMKERAHFDQ